ncbi:PREDICTED: uncharacterized protein LOC107192654 [Dufourea novaeangliae]|uniref:uncharacterized protein LOC107192654 n=1 Tax=Dufourea novaeangliae TaxID=178035 RepID=UPI000767A2A7|nr:PREDICTED: uncharacterized protein LOC107192654 [Dufourea novaeangliae]
MDSVSPPPAKKLRKLTVKDIDIPLLECRREFTLPQQFPSKVMYMKPICNLFAPKNLNSVSSREMLMTNNVKKIRIMTQNGKDLGEVKLKLLSPDLLDKTVAYKKLNVNNKVNMPVTLSFESSRKADKSPQTQEIPFSSKKILLDINNEKCNAENLRKKLVQNPSTLTIPLNNISLNDNAQDKKVFVSSKNHCDCVHNIQATNNGIPKYVKVQKNKIIIPPNMVNSSNLLTKKNGDFNGAKESVPKESALETSTANVSVLKRPTLKINTLEIPIRKVNPLSLKLTKLENRPEEPVLKTALNSNKFKEHLPLVQSKFPVIKCEKLTLPNNRVNINNIDKGVAVMDSNKQNSVSDSKIIEGSDESNKNLNTTRLSSSTDLNENTPMNTRDFGVQVARETITQINHRNKLNLENTIHGEDIDHSQGKDCNSLSTFNNVYPTSESTVSSTNNGKDIDSNEAKQQKQDNWNIIKEALISVKDEELRAKALQALADCGIGIAKHIPITPPEILKTVHDSQIQTDVFGLLDSKSFVLVKEDMPTLQRIKQTEQSAANPMININTSPKPTVTYYNNIDNDYLLPEMCSLPFEDDLSEIEDNLSKLFNGNEDANRVKQMLATPHPLFKKVSSQLKNDFESMHRWDSDGMLSIHRAVVDDNLHEVQRLLFVLKASKMSIDVLTNDGMTCLELAVKSNASKEIVQLLLETGAKPVSLEPIHESAIIIASKLSSPLLPMLLQHVENCVLLNKVDSIGFAPLHYCALYDNLEGVNALLKTSVNVNLKDNRSGRTAFFHALEQNHISVAQVLLAHGAIAGIPNFSGQSVLTLVEEMNNFSLKVALKKIL